MSSSLSIGLGLTMIAGLMSGNCMLPMKFNRSWKWENTWLIFSVVSLVVLPWALALILVDHLAATYSALSLPQIAVPLLLGAGWGVAQVLFGISVQRLGLGLAYAIIVGLGALLGTLVPLFVQHRSQVGGRTLTEILLGVAVMIGGIGLSTWSGQISFLFAYRPLPYRRVARYLMRVYGADAELFLRIRSGDRASSGTPRQPRVARYVCGLAHRPGWRIPS
jgi:multidrug transporter EmrE-like cation transporter